MNIFFAGLFLVAFPVACDAAPGGSLPGVPADIYSSKYQLEKRQVPLACDSNPCLNGGTCTNRPGGFDCACPPGFGGDVCQTPSDPCASNPCLNGGTCTNQPGGFVCACQAGFTGPTCSSGVLTCANNPCSNGATCADIPGGFDCACPLGFTGRLCDIDINECLTAAPCLNGATCVNLSGGFTCNCPSGFTGPICATALDPCASNPCSNGGTCTNQPDGQFVCTCPNGIIGPTCNIDLDECASRPCLNGGSCIDQVNGFQCSCASGFIGQTCEFVDPCDPNPCLNGGSCINRLRDFICSCPAGFTGRLCEVAITVCSLEELDESLSCVGYDAFGWCDISDPVILAFMRQTCNLTCGICQLPLPTLPPTTIPPPVTTPPPPTPPPVCTPEELDESPSCAGYEAFGWCDISDPVISAFMRQTCSLTCGICQRPTTMAPSTMAPSTAPPSTMAPSTAAPLTMAPSTAPPSTMAPSTAPPSTMAPSTAPPSTIAPSTAPPVVPLTAPASPAPPGTTAPPTPEDACLQAHNDKRTLHGSPPLVWNDTLAQEAQVWANHLAATETFVHDPNNTDGENLYFAEAPTASNCLAAVEAWYSEEQLYDYDRPPQTSQEFQEAGVGHFTQIVWKSTTMVGAAIATTGGGMNPIQTYVVARYAPAGNILGQFTENVMRPAVPAK